MPCLILILVVAFPRIVLALLFFFSRYLEHAYHGFRSPCSGSFSFRSPRSPMRGWSIGQHMPVEGVNLLILIVAVVIDVGGLGGGEYQRRRR